MCIAASFNVGVNLAVGSADISDRLFAGVRRQVDVLGIAVHLMGDNFVVFGWCTRVRYTKKTRLVLDHDDQGECVRGHEWPVPR